MNKIGFLLSVACIALAVTPVQAQEEEWDMPVQVGTAQVTEEIDAIELTQPGVVMSRSVAKIVPQVDGEIQKVCFEPGSMVSQGDLLFSLDSVRYQAAKMMAEAHVADSQAQLELAQQSFNRQKSLLEKDVVSQEDYDRAAADLASAKARLLEAQGEQLKAQHDFDHTTIKAPISGMISFYSASEGNYVTEGCAPLCTIVEWQPILVRFPIAVADLWTMFQDYPDTIENSVVRILLGDEEMHSETGHVSFVGNEINTNSDTVMLYVSFPNKDMELLPGANVVVYLTRKEGVKKTAVPLSAIMYDSDGAYVYRVTADDHKVETVRVDVGNVLGGEIQVVESQQLKAGDLVVSSGTHKVMPGSTVKLPEPAKDEQEADKMGN